MNARKAQEAPRRSGKFRTFVPMAGSPDPKHDLNLLLEYFPEVELPVSLSFGSREAFADRNRPLPELLAAISFDLWEEADPDEFTEYQPGFRFRHGKHHALVYWKAALLQYAYVVVILDRQGLLLDKLVLAETDATSGTVRQGAALITAEAEIFTAESEMGSEDALGDPSQTMTERWVITDEGRFRQPDLN